MPILLKRKNGEITPFRNAEYISAFYFIPKSILDKCGEEINSIISSIPNALTNCFPFICMKCYQSCCCHLLPPFAILDKMS